MRALVIGGNRFFGKGLVKRLLDEGVEVTTLNRGHFEDDLGDDIERIVADRNNLENIAELKDANWDIVYDQICYDSHQAAAACRVFNGKTEHLVFTSTASVYNNMTSAVSESEFDPATYVFKKGILSSEGYGEAKRQAEATYVKNAEFGLSLVRLPIVMGEEDYTKRLNFHVEHVLQEQPIFFPDVDAKMSFIHADDASDFLASLSESEAVGPINVCSVEPITIRGFMEEIEKRTLKEALLSPDGDKSPYGVPHGWYMDTAKMRDYDFNPMPILQWLPDLIESVIE